MVIAPPGGGLARQRMAITVQQQVSGGRVLGWSPDPTAPAVVDADEYLVVQGGGLVTINLHYVSNASVSWFHTLGVWVDGTNLTPSPALRATVSTLDWSSGPIQVEDGQRIRLSATSGAVVRVEPGTWIEVTPV